MRKAGNVVCMGIKDCIQDFGGKPEKKRLLGRSSSGWDEHIKMDLKEIGLGNMDWIHLVCDRD
jgi:hypothetical protein